MKRLFVILSLMGASMFAQAQAPSSNQPRPFSPPPLNSIEPADTASPSARSGFKPDDFIPDKEKTPAEIARAAFPSVVLIATQDAHGQPLSLGSGFFIEKDLIATNLHVIEGAAAAYAKIIGQPARLTVEGVVALDGAHDLALLRASNTAAPALPVGSQASVNIGDSIYAIGNPRGLEGTFSQGIVSGVREFGSERILQITAPISPGSSGGPVLNRYGAVVGVSVASLTNGQNLNFAIPADYVKALQAKKTELRAFRSIPESKPGKKLVGEGGHAHGQTGVVGDNFSLAQDHPGFSLSLHNTLNRDVEKVVGVVIFYDDEGKPLDTVSINYPGTIPALAAKRISGQVDASVLGLLESLWVLDSKSHVWRKLARPGDVLSLPRHTKTEVRKGRTEVRILDFTLANE